MFQSKLIFPKLESHIWETLNLSLMRIAAPMQKNTPNRQKLTEICRNGQKQTDLDRNGQKLTETEKIYQTISINHDVFADTFFTSPRHNCFNPLQMPCQNVNANFSESFEQQIMSGSIFFCGPQVSTAFSSKYIGKPNKLDSVAPLIADPPPLKLHQ